MLLWRRVYKRCGGPPGHQPYGLWRRGGERHGCLSWEGGIRYLLPPKEPPGQKDLYGLAYAVSAIHAFAGEADPDVFEVEGTTAAQKSHRVPIFEPCGIFVRRVLSDGDVQPVLTWQTPIQFQSTPSVWGSTRIRKTDE